LKEKDRAEEIMRLWNESDMIIRPQSDKARKEIAQRKKERVQRADGKGIQEYKRQIREKMGSGEPVSFRDIYFELERLNGIPEGEVMDAVEKADELIEKYSDRAADRIDEQFLQKFVQEMFGDSDDYEFGQGSVVRYFNSGKRNCVSVAKGEMIVLEGVIARLSQDVQFEYRLGLNKLKQHEIATISEGETTFFLEPPILSLINQVETAGTKTVPLDEIKRAMVFERTIIQNAKAGKPGEVEPSPTIDFVSDQPVSDGIIVRGDLKGSDFVRLYAVQQNIVPVPKNKEEERIMEVELIEGEVGDPGPEEARKRVEEANNKIQDWATHDKPFIVDATDYTRASLKSILGFKLEAPDKMTKIAFPDVSSWPIEAVKLMLQISTETLSLKSPSDGSMPAKLLQAMYELTHRKNKSTYQPMFPWDRLYIETPGTNSAFNIHQNPEIFKMILGSVKASERAKDIVVGFSYSELSEEEARIIALGGLKGVYLEGMYGGGKDPNRVFEILKKGKQVLYFNYKYFSYLYMGGMGRKRPDMTNFRLDIKNTDTKDLKYLLNSIEKFEPNDQDERLKRAANWELNFRINPRLIAKSQKSPEY
jgi:hypothetical protein